MSDHISKFIDLMSKHGAAPARAGDIKDDDTKRRYAVAGDRAGQKNGVYMLKPECGWFINFKEGVTHTWTNKGSREWNAAEKQAWKKRVEAERAEKENALAETRKAAALKALEVWKAAELGTHPYLVKKGIVGRSARVNGDELIIPAYKNGTLVSVQRILNNGTKLFLEGGDIKGAYGSIGKAGDVIYICEGYATACSVHEATGAAAVWAFNAGNLAEVGKAIRGKYATAKLVFAADNDQWTAIGNKPVNVGIDKARQAAVAVGGYVVWPNFPADDADKGTDWNDYSLRYGKEQVKICLEAAGSQLRGETEPADAAISSDDLSPPSYFSDIPDAEEYHSRELIEAGDNWRELLITTGEGKLQKGSLKNIILFLMNHPELKGVFRMNDFQHEIYVVSCPPWEDESAFRVHRLEDNDITQAAAAIEKFGLSPDTNKVFKAICVAADLAKFHPGREYFAGLRWDKTPRLKNWLSYYLGAEDDEDDYLSFIGTKWMVAAVKRIHEPGCKFDHILVMEGRQGIGKSTAFETLATFGRDEQATYFTDNIKLADIQNKDTVMLLQGSIIVELAELAGMKKQDDEIIKGWITHKTDRCRLPYGKTVTDFARQFVLCGTTNNYDYLKDASGNRRYWPFRSSAVDLKALAADREQLWAEALHLYRGGTYIGPTPEEALLATQAQEKRRSHDVWEDNVLEAIADIGFDGTITSIFRHMGIGVRDRDHKAQGRVANILRVNGYDNKVQSKGGRSARRWVKE